MKICKKCGECKSLDDFHNNKTTRDGKQAYCRACNNARVKQWQAENPERFKASWKTPEVTHRQRARKYGLTSGELHSLIAAYPDGCPLCDRDEPLVVDHDHATGKVRGMLCGTCNKALGALGDNVEGLQRAIEYLRVSKTLAV